jgi:hypothetical protein
VLSISEQSKSIYYKIYPYPYIDAECSRNWAAKKELKSKNTALPRTLNKWFRHAEWDKIKP